LIETRLKRVSSRTTRRNSWYELKQKRCTTVALYCDYLLTSVSIQHDPEAVGAMSHTVKLDTIDFSDGVDAIYMSGGHGTCVDYIDNPALKAAIESMYASGKVVAADCHGPLCLVDCVKPDGSPLVKDKTVTGFANSEEVAVKLDKVVPFLLETRFKEQGAKYEKEDDWNVKVCVDGNLVTGQNPQSSEACAKAVINLL